MLGEKRVEALSVGSTYTSDENEMRDARCAGPSGYRDCAAVSNEFSLHGYTTSHTSWDPDD